MQIFLFLALLIAFTLVLFAVQNSALVTVNFLAFHFEGSLAFILVVVFASGVLSGILMTIPSLWKKSSALRQQRRKVKQLEESVAMAAACQSQGKQNSEKNKFHLDLSLESRDQSCLRCEIGHKSTLSKISAFHARNILLK